MSNDLRSVLNHAICDELDSALSRIAHCVNQLSDEQIWSRPAHGLNAIGNLLLHLTGNVKQMIADNLSGTPDTRNRPAEFNSREALPKAELLRRLTDVLQQAKSALIAVSEQRLVQVVRVNNFDLTGIQAVVRSVAHFRGHTQEIIHMTREMLGEKYQFAGAK